jgi:hypothetical protein
MWLAPALAAALFQVLRSTPATPSALLSAADVYLLNVSRAHLSLWQPLVVLARGRQRLPPDPFLVWVRGQPLPTPGS